MDALVAKSTCTTISGKSRSLSKSILIWFAANESTKIGFTVRSSASSIKWRTMIVLSAFRHSTKIYLPLVIDLRSIEDNMKHATGKKIVNTQSGFLRKIGKLATTVDVMCRTHRP